MVSSSFHPSSGGVSSAHYNLYRILKKLGFIVRVFAYADPDRTAIPDVIKKTSPRVLQRLLSMTSAIYFRLKGDRQIRPQLHSILNSCWALAALRRPIRKFHPDVLIVPDISAPSFFIGKVPKCKTILIAHHNPARFLNNPLIGLYSDLDAKLAIAIEKKGLRNVDKIICPSEYMKREFEATYRVDKPVAVVPNILDEEYINCVQPRKVYLQCGLSENAIIIYIPSAGSDVKGARYVYEIVRRLSKYCAQQNREVGFYLSGVLNKAIQYELQFLDSNARIFALGKVSYEENIAFVKTCSFAVSPTLLESFGMAILEANVCGLPVVTFDCGGNRELIENGENGFIAPYLDVECLVQYAQRLLDDDLRSSMSKKARELARSKFGSDKVVKEFIQEIMS